jgi:hypothetical protein
MQVLGRHPRRARFARSSSRMSFAQAKAAMLSASKIKGKIRSAIMTHIYYYCFPHYSYACQGFRFRYSLALLKQVFSVDSPAGELSEAKTSFRLRAPLRVTGFAFLGKQ